MAADLAQERKWQLETARTLSQSVLSFHSKQASHAARRQKLELEAQRRLAPRLAPDVKNVWAKYATVYDDQQSVIRG